MGLTPSNDGQVIRLQIPELTEERRSELVKVVHGIAEQGRVAVRNVRRDVMHDLRELKSEGEVGSDDEHRAEAELQKLTDSHVGEIDTRPRRQGRRDPRGVSDAAARARYVAIITDGNGRWAQSARAAGAGGAPGRRRRGQGAAARRRRARHRAS